MNVPSSTLSIIGRFQSSAPVNVTALAEALGLRVWEDAALAKGISGKLFRDPSSGGPEGYSIVVRASDAYVRRRFTVAHEIAHFILHRDRIGSSLTDDAMYRSGLSTREEAEANRLAADILMPRTLIAHYIKSYGSADPGVLASIFNVSEAAMRIRLSA
jgi:Zn-dependent peptidase ImmA (M78 family)